MLKLINHSFFNHKGGEGGDLESIPGPFSGGGGLCGGRGLEYKTPLS